MNSRRAAAGMAQRGMALVVSLLFLLVVTLVTVVAATNGARSFKMATNMQDLEMSFQAAEAGASAALGLAGSPGTDPFQRVDNAAPFATLALDDNHPLRNLADPSTVSVQVFVEALDRPCPRLGSDRGNSVDLFNCDYYRVVSAHSAPGRSRTRVEIGVIEPIVDVN
jgi:hypothetical protein